MTTADKINIVIGVLSLILGATAHIRISIKDGNKIGSLAQKITGNGNKQSGRDSY